MRSPSDKGRMKRILVVDDDDNLRELLATVLSQDGRVVDTARDGIEALELLNQNRYDLIYQRPTHAGSQRPRSL